jgi:hypothetical protein
MKCPHLQWACISKAYSKLGFGISPCIYLHVAPPWLGLSWSLHHEHCEEEEEEEEEEEIFFFLFSGYIYSQNAILKTQSAKIMCF